MSACQGFAWLKQRLGQPPPAFRAAGAARQAAVLVPIIGSRDAELLLCERTQDVLEHKGEICFPGGCIEPQDASPIAAALREAREELALPAHSISVLGVLPDVFTRVSNYVITPVVGHMRELPQLSLHPSEVARTLLVSLRALIAQEGRRVSPGGTGGDVPQAYEYTAAGTLIWGATARIIHALLDALSPAWTPGGRHI